MCSAYFKLCVLASINYSMTQSAEIAHRTHLFSLNVYNNPDIQNFNNSYSIVYNIKTSILF